MRTITLFITLLAAVPGLLFAGSALAFQPPHPGPYRGWSLPPAPPAYNRAAPRYAYLRPAYPAPWYGPAPRYLRKRQAQPQQGPQPGGAAARPQPSPTTPQGPSQATATPVATVPAAPADVPAGQIPRGTPDRAVASTVDDTRQAFLDRLEPIIRAENARLRELRGELEALFAALARTALDTAGRGRLQTLARRYRVDGDLFADAAVRQDLLARVDTIPLSLALAQAVNESAWGTSRFAREGNNLFGIWTYDESKGIVPKKRAAGKKHLVRRFDSLHESVRYYVHNLNSHPAYAELRELRAAARARGTPPDGLALAAGLTRYSAKGATYVRLIKDIIRRYKLASLDTPRRNQA